MILSIRVDNFLAFSNEVELSLEADLRVKKFFNSVCIKNGFNALKSVCIYGANNSGKTCLMQAIKSIKNVLLGLTGEFSSNLFRNDSVCAFGVTFIENNRVFSYDFKYDISTLNGCRKGFIYESFKELIIGNHKRIFEKELFIRDTINGIYRFNEDKELSDVMSMVSNNNILIYTINVEKYPKLEEYKTILQNFANSVEIIDMNNIPLAKTIRVLKNDEEIKEKTIELIKCADLDIEDYLYLNDDSIFNEIEIPNPREIVIKTAIAIEDRRRLISKHNGRLVQSMTFDSTGTKKMVALASYIVDALKNGKTLVIDELDSSLHFKLTRAIVALFNNDLNTNGQLIFTAQDATLLDCKRLFRKDQIWFISKDKDNVYLYSLADFTSKGTKNHLKTDLFDEYISGALGVAPEPDLISIFLDKNE